MNSVLATTSQHFSPADNSGAKLEKMDRLMTKLSRHPSPEANPNSTPVIHSPQGSRPETPKIPSLPATPGSHHGPEYVTPESARPRSLESGSNANEESCVRTSNDSVQGKQTLLDCSNPPSLSPPSVNVDYQSPSLAPNWFEIVQQLTTICQGKLGATENSANLENPAVADKEMANPMSMARSILSNLNQLLFTSKPSVEAGKSRPDDLTLPSINAPPSFSDLGRSSGNIENDASRPDSTQLKSVSHRTPTTASPSPFSLPNPLPNPDPITSATASLLAMMMEQKQLNPDTSSVTSNPFLVLPSFWPNSFASQPGSVSSMQPPVSVPIMSKTSNCATESNIQKLPFPTDFPDNRGFLYHLGQQLMAMATAPGTEPLLRSPLWNFPSNPETTTLPIPSCASSSSVPTVPVFQPTTSTSLLTDPMLAIMNAALFQTPTQPSMLSTTSLAASAKHPPIPGQTMVHPIKADKNVQNFSPHNAAMTGISMRGNQKYSAYYQHQRKQGLQYGGVTNENIMNGSLNRRQTPSLSVPFPCSRLGNRRLKGGPLNSTASDFRGSPSVLGSRGVTGGGGTASHMFPASRGGPFKHSSAISTSNRLKSQLPTDMMHSTNVANDSTHKISSRLRDTAFLCSCGQDFESLYGFSVHMKDTGHKPKSDHSERDIPKLVRGQDMWINSETEQTREILRCMRCHQSFRNLPELTWHMMKTNHYSEIVYNDSGRLVFVNPDEQKRSTQNGTAIQSAGSSPSKSVCQTNNKRGGVASVVKHSSPTQVTENRLQDSEVDPPDTHEKVTHLRDRMPLANSSADSTSSARSEAFGYSSPESKLQRDSPVVVSSAISDAHEQSAKVPSFHEHSVTASPDSRTSDKAVSSAGCSVIKQIESFVESNLAQKTHLLTARAENTSSIASRVSSPASVADSRSGLQDNSSDCRNSPCDARKRTISGTSPVHAPSNASSSSPSTNCEKSRDSPYAFAAKRANLSPKSPVKVSSCSTSGFSVSNTENPLSSLQKLVDTTHKSPYVMMPGTVSNCPNFHGNQQAGMTGNSQSKHSPQALGRAQTPKNKTLNFSSGSMSSSPTFTDLLLPTRPEDDHVPALSALYAYVEKSSNTQPEPRNTKECGARACLTGPGDMDKSNSEHELMNSQSFQALYAAALSRLTSHYLQTATTTGKATDSGIDPAQFFRNVANNFEQSLQSAIRLNEIKSDNFSSTGWAKLMQTFSAPSSEQTTSVDPRESSSNASRTSPFEDDPEHQLDEARHYSEEYEKHGSRNTRTHHPMMQDDTRANKVGRYGPGAQMTSRQASFVGAASPQSSPPLSNSETAHFNRTSTTSTGCVNPLMAMRTSGSTNNGNQLMSSIITKKAKCHFCGKPFANKGQVRLHISKNKCPCLLQRSCHVAALAAAFGSDSPQPGAGALTGTNKRNIPNAINLPRAPGGMSSNKNLAQLMLSDACLQAHEESAEQPSALSLLKERFQNFDKALMGNRPVPEDMHQRDRFSEPLNYQNIVNAHDRVGAGAIGHRNAESAMEVESYSSQVPLPKNADAPTALAATNAGHLAAMALLAQTLVQLGSAQAPRLPDLSRSVSMAAVSDKESNLQLPVPPLLAQASASATPDLMNGLSWDWLLSHLNLAKQMSSFTWPGQATEQQASQDSTADPIVPLHQGGGTPTSSS